jgi:nucleotide-binding universal stress UspA family protein
MTAKPIVAATDGSEHSLLAVEWAAREALLRGAPLRIVAVAAMPPRMADRRDSHDVDTVADVLSRNRDEALSAAAGRAAAAAPGLLIATDVLTGPPAQAIVDSGSGALMLVVGCRGMGTFAAMVLGSVSRYAASHAPCPAVVVRDESGSAHGVVAVGLGDLDDCSAALTFAFEEAAARKASLTAIHAFDTPPADLSRPGKSFMLPSLRHAEEEAGRQLEELLADWRRKYPDVQVSHDVVHGHPGRALVSLSEHADLVVIGRHAEPSVLPGPGAVRHAVLNHAHGPVAVVPSA